MCKWFTSRSFTSFALLVFFFVRAMAASTDAIFVNSRFFSSSGDNFPSGSMYNDTCAGTIKRIKVFDGLYIFAKALHEWLQHKAESAQFVRVMRGLWWYPNGTKNSCCRSQIRQVLLFFKLGFWRAYFGFFARWYFLRGSKQFTSFVFEKNCVCKLRPHASFAASFNNNNNERFSLIVETKNYRSLRKSSCVEWDGRVWVGRVWVWVVNGDFENTAKKTAP